MLNSLQKQFYLKNFLMITKKFNISHFKILIYNMHKIVCCTEKLDKTNKKFFFKNYDMLKHSNAYINRLMFFN